MNFFLVPITFLINALIILFFYKKIRNKNIKIYEKKSESLNQEINRFAKNWNLTLEKIPLYTTSGLAYLRKSLPKELPNIYLYCDHKDETRTPYRTFWLLQGKVNESQVKVYFLPEYFTEKAKTKGTMLCCFPIATTKHWITIQSEDLWNLIKDHELESRIFNNKFELRGSEHKMLTEIFDPLLIEKFNVYYAAALKITVLHTSIIAAHRFIFNTQEIDHFFNLILDFKKILIQLLNPSQGPCKTIPAFLQEAGISKIRIHYFCFSRHYWCPWPGWQGFLMPPPVVH